MIFLMVPFGNAASYSSQSRRVEHCSGARYLIRPALGIALRSTPPPVTVRTSSPAVPWRERPAGGESHRPQQNRLPRMSSACPARKLLLSAVVMDRSSHEMGLDVNLGPCGQNVLFRAGLPIHLMESGGCLGLCGQGYSHTVGGASFKAPGRRPQSAPRPKTTRTDVQVLRDLADGQLPFQARHFQWIGMHSLCLPQKIRKPGWCRKHTKNIIQVLPLKSRSSPRNLRPGGKVSVELHKRSVAFSPLSLRQFTRIRKSPLVSAVKKC